MIKQSKVICILIGFLLTGCNYLEADPQTAKPDVVKAKDAQMVEYAVFSALIEGLYLKDNIKLITIRDHTALHPLISDDLDKEAERVKQKMPDLSQETVTNFIERNQNSYPLEQAFNLRVPYVLISEKEREEIFQNADGWQLFYKRYPASQGLMTLSKVGFNSAMDQALVYVGNQYAGLGGVGYYAVLIKKGETWVIKEFSGAWIS